MAKIFHVCIMIQTAWKARLRVIIFVEVTIIGSLATLNRIYDLIHYFASSKSSPQGEPSELNL